MDRRVRLCALENAAWCDAVARAHGLPGASGGGLWTQPRPAPPYHPNVVTLDDDASTARVDAIRALAFRCPAPFWVKDSFAAIDLASAGFEPVIDARWLWRDPAPVARTDAGMAWSWIDDAESLERWEGAWTAAGSPAPRRVFPTALLAGRDVAFLAAARGGRIEAGCVLSRSAAGVVGLTNFFAPEACREDARAGALARAVGAASGAPIAGYAGGREIEDWRALGFRSIGDLRIWRRP